MKNCVKNSKPLSIIGVNRVKELLNNMGSMKHQATKNQKARWFMNKKLMSRLSKTRSERLHN